MPRLRRSRLLVPAVLLLSSAALCGQANDSIPAALPAAIEAEPLSESGVRLARLLEEDVDESELTREPGKPYRITRFDDQSLSVAGMPASSLQVSALQNSAAPFSLIQAALLTLSAGGATGGIWFAVLRLRGRRSPAAAPAEMPPARSDDADLLARVIAGNARITEEAIESFELSRVFGSATASNRYRMEISPPAMASPQVPPYVPGDGRFHRLSEAVTAVEAPHSQSRPPVLDVERQAAQCGVVP